MTASHGWFCFRKAYNHFCMLQSCSHLWQRLLFLKQLYFKIVAGTRDRDPYIWSTLLSGLQVASLGQLPTRRRFHFGFQPGTQLLLLPTFAPVYAGSGCILHTDQSLNPATGNASGISHKLLSVTTNDENNCIPMQNIASFGKYCLSAIQGKYRDNLKLLCRVGYWPMLAFNGPINKDITTCQRLGYNSRNLSIRDFSCDTQDFLYGRVKAAIFSHWSRAKEKEKGKPGHNTLIMRGSFWLVQIISCSVRGSRLLLEDQNTDCTLIPNPIDLRGWVSCTQF